MKYLLHVTLVLFSLLKKIKIETNNLQNINDITTQICRNKKFNKDLTTLVL